MRLVLAVLIALSRHASVGLAFSAGHSTVVVVAGAAVVAGASWIRSVLEPGSQAAWVLGLLDGTVAGGYLVCVAAANLPQVVAAVRALRSGDEVGPPRGPLTRLLNAPLSRVTHPAHIFVFGLLFGLGFDTASSVSILMLTGAGTLGTAGVPLAMLALPIMFAAAMTLGDTVNALLMLRMYSAAVSTRQRVWFNLVITGISVASALLIAVVTLGGVLVDDLGLPIPGLDVVAHLDTEWWGVGLVVVFLVVGAVALLRWVLGRHRAASSAAA